MSTRRIVFSESEGMKRVKTTRGSMTITEMIAVAEFFEQLNASFFEILAMGLSGTRINLLRR